MLGVFLLGAAWISAVLRLTLLNGCLSGKFEIGLCVFVTEALNIYDGGVSSTTTDTRILLIASSGLVTCS